jgi:tartrate-resistant acid phosphatase type 5
MHFLAVGDFGSYTPDGAEAIARAMSKYCDKLASPASFVLGLGDNFYPHGVAGINDPWLVHGWGKTFLSHANLRVPWYMVLGNHCYEGDHTAQISFTFHESNPEGLWRMPSECYKVDDMAEVVLFALDTNGAQMSTRLAHPHLEQDLSRHREWLVDGLAGLKEDNDTRVRIVFAHHPMFTKGRLHGAIGRCLRDKRYTFTRRGTVTTANGYDFGTVLPEGGVDLYITGHEHVMQAHEAGGVLHIVAGAALDRNNFYGGEDLEAKIDWVDPQQRQGFVAVEIAGDEIIVRFVGVDAEVFKTIVRKKRH